MKSTPPLLLLLLLLLLAAAASAEDTMFGGECLAAGQFLESGPYTFVMQSDCNLVLYVNGKKALWASGTYKKGSSCHADLQVNGNLVIFSGAGDVLWTSNSSRGTQSYRLVVQTDGNVVIYGGAVWATNTVQRRKRRLF